MKRKYKLKSWVLVCVYLLTIGAMVVSLYFVGKVLKSSVYNNDSLSYVYRDLIDTSVPVVAETDSKFSKPFNVEGISVIKKFYDKDADAENQEQAIIFYENTYMPSTGVLYSKEDVFDVISPMDGTVESITNDEIMGNVVTIKHTNNLTTIYQSLNEVTLMVGDSIKKGDVIGTSGENKIDSTSSFMLMFEVEKDGKFVNPETLYDTEINELS